MNVLKFKLTLNTCKLSNNTLSERFAIVHTSKCPYIVWLVSRSTLSTLNFYTCHSLICSLHFVYSIAQMKIVWLCAVWCTVHTPFIYMYATRLKPITNVRCHCCRIPFYISLNYAFDLNCMKLLILLRSFIQNIQNTVRFVNLLNI